MVIDLHVCIFGKYVHFDVGQYLHVVLEILKSKRSLVIVYGLLIDLSNAYSSIFHILRIGQGSGNNLK